jgi:hypothetical protein
VLGGVWWWVVCGGHSTWHVVKACLAPHELLHALWRAGEGVFMSSLLGEDCA